ncbi:MAG: sugar-binding transcriptional regulator [Streptosporangiales bacterium]|nr:sugar-binding transcriptional regulator [Streptosporangiales bacterium]
MTQEEIAKHLTLTRWKVGRMLKEARDQGIVKIEIVHPRARLRHLEAQVQSRYAVRQAIVVPAHGDGETQRRDVAKAAADCLSDLRPVPSMVGVSWGRTMDELAAVVAPGWARGVEVVQVNGAVTRGRNPSGGAVAAELARQGPGSVRLLAAPAIVGSAATRQVIEADDSVKQVLEAARGADVLLFSLGALSADSVLVESGYLSAKDVARLRAVGAVGDVLGRFIGADGREVSDELSARTVALSLDEIRQAPVTIAVASGVEKAAVAHAALTSGMCTILVADSDVVEGILRLDAGQ